MLMSRTLFGVILLLGSISSNLVAGAASPEQTYVRPLNEDCVARELGNSLGPDGSLFPTPFVMDGDGSTRDGFKTTVNTAVGFTVTYYDTYKVVDNTISGQTYVLYVCGSDKPSVGAPGVSEDAKFFQIPLTSVSVAETVPYAFLEALGVDDRVHDVSPFVTSACGQKRVNECGKSAPAYVDFASNSLNQTVMKDAKANVDSIIVSFGEDDSVFLSFDAEDDPGVLNRAEWIKYLGLFFNKEKYASDIYNGIVESYEETAKAAAEKGESKPRIAWVSHFVYGDDEHYDVSLAAYKKQYIDDANGQNVDIDEILKEYPGARVSAFSPTTVEFAWDGNDSFETKEEAQKAFVEFMSSLDGVIDETFAMDPMAYGVEEFKKEFGLTNADAKTLSWLEPGLIFRLDGELSETKGLDWFETAFTRPDLVLKDVDRVVDSSRQGSVRDSDDVVWMRSIAETPRINTANDCTRVSACDDKATTICPFVASCEDGGTRLLKEDSFDSGVCDYQTCIQQVDEPADTAQMAAPAVILLTLLIVFVEALINFC
ncbi:hypothetical protein M9435_000411 [Picochlorum sp. BPE23]|nr:hypothetical protein M9435_000411 [Picochlorum sp. BPE23]